MPFVYTGEIGRWYVSDPVWDRVRELCEGYPAEFNASAAYDVVLAAWKMGFDVVKAPAGSDLYLTALRAQNEALHNAVDRVSNADDYRNA